MQLRSRVAVAVCRPAAVVPIGPLAWETPYAEGVAQEMAKRQKKKNPWNGRKYLYIICVIRV